MGENLYRLFFVRYKKIKSLNRRGAEAQSFILLIAPAALLTNIKVFLCVSAPLRFSLF